MWTNPHEFRLIEPFWIFILINWIQNQTCKDQTCESGFVRIWDSRVRICKGSFLYYNTKDLWRFIGFEKTGWIFWKLAGFVITNLKLKSSLLKRIYSHLILSNLSLLFHSIWSHLHDKCSDNLHLNITVNLLFEARRWDVQLKLVHQLVWDKDT